MHPGGTFFKNVFVGAAPDTVPENLDKSSPGTGFSRKFVILAPVYASM